MKEFLEVLVFGMCLGVFISYLLVRWFIESVKNK
jgi:hypothetical protein